MSKFKGVKTDNAKINAKVDIRKKSLEYVEHPKVLEVYCGTGQMYSDVWHLAEDYTGVDKRKFFDKRHTICGDALAAVKSIDVNQYNIFDIDAYGSPYEVLLSIAKRLDVDKVSFCITDGVNMDLKMGRLCHGIRDILGIDNKILKRAHLIHDLIIKEIMQKIADITSMKVENKRIAKGVTGSAMRYYAFDMARL